MELVRVTEKKKVVWSLVKHKTSWFLSRYRIFHSRWIIWDLAMGEIWAVTTWTVIIDPPDTWAVTLASYWQQGKYLWLTRTSRAFIVVVEENKYIKKYFLVCLTNISLLIMGISRMFATVLRNWCCHATDQEVSWQVTWHIRDAAWHLWRVTLIYIRHGATRNIRQVLTPSSLSWASVTVMMISFQELLNIF